MFKLEIEDEIEQQQETENEEKDSIDNVFDDYNISEIKAFQISASTFTMLILCQGLFSHGNRGTQ